MTNLNPSHFPGLQDTDDRTTGQAVQTSVPKPASGRTSALKKLSEQLAEASRKRREAKGEPVEPEPKHRKGEGENSDEESEDEDRVAIPPIPDLRFEQGVLASLRPFIHRVALSPSPSSLSAAAVEPTEETEKRTEAAEKEALVSTSLTAEGEGQAGDAAVDVFDLSQGIRVEWSRVTYVLLRDQVVFPLLQGALWAVGGYYLSAAWAWNKLRVEHSSKGLPRPSLLRSLGIRV